MKSKAFLTVPVLGVLALVAYGCVVQEKPADSAPAAAPATAPAPATAAPVATDTTVAPTATDTTPAPAAPIKTLGKPVSADGAADGG
jgi:hypothetical protein